MAIRFLKLAAAYLMLGVTIGFGMGITHQFQYAPVHAHVNLLGWATQALVALIYRVFPQAAETRLARLLLGDTIEVTHVELDVRVQRMEARQGRGEAIARDDVLNAHHDRPRSVHR